MTTPAVQVGDRPRPTPGDTAAIPMPTSPPPTDPPPATMDLTHEELSPLLDVLDAKRARAQQDVDNARQGLADAERRLSDAATNHALLKARMDTLGTGTVSLMVK